MSINCTYKQKEVVNNLQRLGKIELPEVSPIVGSETIYFYRNKMEFSFSDSKWLTQEEIDSGEMIENRNALGFHIPGMWDKIIDIKEMPFTTKTRAMPFGIL